VQLGYSEGQNAWCVPRVHRLLGEANNTQGGKDEAG
jgi:hypothetical protein